MGLAAETIARQKRDDPFEEAPVEFFRNLKLSAEQVQWMCRGWHAIAACDGVHEAEDRLLRECYDAIRAPGSPRYSEVAGKGFDVADGLALVPSVPLRELYIKTAWLMAFADGKLTTPERETIAAHANALGLSPAQSTELQAQVKEYLLEQLSHLKNTAAVAQISRALGLV